MEDTEAPNLAMGKKSISEGPQVRGAPKVGCDIRLLIGGTVAADQMGKACLCNTSAGGRDQIKVRLL